MLGYIGNLDKQCAAREIKPSVSVGPRQGHPMVTLAHCKLGPLLRFEQHRETSQKRLRIRPVVIDHGLVDDQRTIWRQRPIRLLQEHPLCRQTPIMEDATHDEHFGTR